MKIPVRPPDLIETVKGFASEPLRLMKVLETVKSPTVSEEYLPWDKLRHREPPGGLTSLEWWFGIKAQRRGRPTPLLDKQKKPFQFNLVDPLNRYLHEIDLQAGGSIQMPALIDHEDEKKTFIVRSLIEEAFASSQLEGAASTRAIAKQLILEERTPRDQREIMILNNYKTMQMIAELKETPLSQELVFKIHQMVTSETLNDPTGAGRFRRGGEEIVVGDDEGNTLHTPPDPSELESRMEAMCRFANQGNSEPFIHPAIRAMILHFWLAYDHPFIDGNGRTARALFYWSMLSQGYWLFEYISISQIILKSPTQYGRAFLNTEIDDNDLSYFLIYHADIVGKAIVELTNYIETRSGELKQLEAELRGLSTLNARQKELVRHALRHPGEKYNVETHRALHGVSRQSANNDLLQLVDKRLFLQRNAGRQKVYFASPRMEDLLRGSD